MRTLIYFCLAAVVFGAACSDDKTSAKDAATKDKGLAFADAKAADAPGRDSAGKDAAKVDAPTTDAAKKADARKPDALRPDRGGPISGCVKDADCRLDNDCCLCKAVLTTSPRPPLCPIKCKQPTCNGWSLRTPHAYCVKGRCIVGDKSPCGKGCRLINDCCRCMAVPLTASIPTCPIKTCFVPTCTALFLGSAKAQCQSSSCVLVP